VITKLVHVKLNKKIWIDRGSKHPCASKIYGKENTCAMRNEEKEIST